MSCQSHRIFQLTAISHVLTHYSGWQWSPIPQIGSDEIRSRNIASHRIGEAVQKQAQHSSSNGTRPLYGNEYIVLQRYNRTAHLAACHFFLLFSRRGLLRLKKLMNNARPSSSHTHTLNTISHDTLTMVSSDKPLNMSCQSHRIFQLTAISHVLTHYSGWQWSIPWIGSHRIRLDPETSRHIG